jgi:hypothetical protein
MVMPDAVTIKVMIAASRVLASLTAVFRAEAMVPISAYRASANTNSVRNTHNKPKTAAPLRPSNK